MSENREYNALAIIESTTNTSAMQALTAISQFQQVVRQTLKDGYDYGVIPGVNKPSLFKPGAEKINMLFRSNPKYEFLDRTADYEKGLFIYEIRCTLYHSSAESGNLVEVPISQGVGSCNNKEKKFRYLNVYESDLPKGVDKNTLVEIKIRGKNGKPGYSKYQIENPDPCSLANTILKMAKKRAYIDATLQLAALSEIFTQDMEDLTDTIDMGEVEYTAPADRGAAAKPHANPAPIDVTPQEESQNQAPVTHAETDINKVFLPDVQYRVEKASAGKTKTNKSYTKILIKEAGHTLEVYDYETHDVKEGDFIIIKVMRPIQSRDYNGRTYYSTSATIDVANGLTQQSFEEDNTDLPFEV
jgi:hypothetical protein